ncbi:MAG: winged helix-turn-helix domain-containing protein [Pyrinomonadaceae bacterium]|nr:winged helix-turn-helix domain-containing protein [Pyrinomonadaceae bacterium]
MKTENRETNCYKFADFTLETEAQTLSRQNEPIHLAKRPFEILLFLIENRERVVSRDELLDKFWDGHDVYDDVLRKTVSAIRHALHDTKKPAQLIETRRGSGFRFIGEVEEVQSEQSKVNSLKAEVKPLTVFDEPTNQQNFAPPKISFWRSRIVLLSILGLILFLSASFAVNSYLPRNAKNDRRQMPKIAAIAVLPLRNLTGDAANDYLSDGLSEGLINEFSRHGELKVISRSSSFAFKNKDVEPRDIGEKLQVEAILEGSLRKFGDEMRLEVNLVDARDGKVLWTNDAAKSSLRNIFTAQNKIACEVLAKIEAGNCSPPEAAQNIDAEAYRLYLQGVQLRKDLSLEAMTKAVGFYEQALKIAPNFAEAHGAIATTYVIMESNSQVPPRSVIKKAEFHANEALKIDENSVDALLVLSETKTSENYDLKLSESLLRQAVEKNPNHARARMWLANVLTVRGKFAEAESQLLYAQQIDPLSPGVRLNLSELYLYWRKPEKAIEQSDFLLDQNAANPSALLMKARAYLQKGDIEQARKFWEMLSDKDDDSSIDFLIKQGKTVEARTAIEKLAAAERGVTSPYRIGCLYAALGDREKAFGWLEKSYDVRQADLISMKIDPALDSLHDDARYQDLLRRINLSD